MPRSIEPGAEPELELAIEASACKRKPRQAGGHRGNPLGDPSFAGKRKATEEPLVVGGLN